MQRADPTLSQRLAGLTPRQREVLALVARDRTNFQIADELEIGYESVKSHVSAILLRLDVATREEAAQVWRREQGAAWLVRRLTGGLLLSGAVKVGVAFAVIAVAVAVVFALGVDTGYRGTSSDPTVPLPASPTTTTLVDCLPLVDDRAPILTGASFPTDSTGFVVGSDVERTAAGEACLYLARTLNGGATWERLPIPPIPKSTGEQGGNAVASVAFANDQVGWLYGPGLWQTTDGGATWSDISDSLPDVTSIVVAGDNAWMVAGDSCGNCQRLYEATAPGSWAWRPLANQPPLPSEAIITSVTRDSATNAFVLGWNEDSGSIAAAATTDGGGSWNAIAPPVAATSSQARPDFDASGGTLWLSTGSQPAGTFQTKGIFRSSDSGRTWAALDTRNVAGNQFTLTVTSATDVFASESRGLLQGSFDGGETWETLLPAEETVANSARLLAIRRGGPGIASTTQSTWWTNDGGHSWRTITLPR